MPLSWKEKIAWNLARKFTKGSDFEILLKESGLW